MLSLLRIKNLALVADLTLPLQPGYNVITGETGAGKSIIIGALNLALGERADRAAIRSGAESCTVEAVFAIGAKAPWLERFLDAHGLEPAAEDQLIVKRTFTAAGANRQFINGSPTTLQVLSALGAEWVDMHGPHEHQSLLSPARQLDILDAFAGAQPAREKFSGLIRRLAELEAEKAGLIVDERTYAQQLDLLRHQSSEISAARLQADEEERATQDFQRASNGARLLELSQEALNLLSENDTALLAQAGELGRTLQNLHRLDPGAGNLAPLHEQAVVSWSELQSALRHYADAIEIDPARLRELEERVNLLQSLKRKYGGSVADVIAFGEEARRKLQALEQRDAELVRLNSALEKIRAEVKHAGQELSAQRRRAVPKLAKAAMIHLRDLGFQQCHFEISLKTDEALAALPRASGLDEIEFQFAPNVGEPARPLRAIASSGEMSRVMLALKTALAAEDEIPLLVFDEIDANVGGETGPAIGEKMAQIARQRQVICITHLPPVAAAAASHYVVSKRLEGGRTISEITLLEAEDRVNEIARMLGGQSDAARRHAREMLKRKVES
ncbi:MAG TPA: DNA repair protein RecN [Verrucomicrobiae bacterium]|jgi:DNA repair protein RecN (Recombination protein N)|nr:DNA repair protein RecN [Verrucomicrobiae bacterium]